MKYGWLHGSGKYMLYVYENSEWWGVTDDFFKANSFKSIEECQTHFLSKHAIPENFEHCLHNGYLKYFDNNGQMIIV